MVNQRLLVHCLLSELGFHGYDRCYLCLSHHNAMLCSKTPAPQTTIHSSCFVQFSLAIPLHPLILIERVTEFLCKRWISSHRLYFSPPTKSLTKAEVLILNLIPSLLPLFPRLLVIPATPRLMHHLRTLREIALWSPAIATAMIYALRRIHELVGTVHIVACVCYVHGVV